MLLENQIKKLNDFGIRITEIDVLRAQIENQCSHCNVPGALLEHLENQNQELCKLRDATEQANKNIDQLIDIKAGPFGAFLKREQDLNEITEQIQKASNIEREAIVALANAINEKHREIRRMKHFFEQKDKEIANLKKLIKSGAQK